MDQEDRNETEPENKRVTRFQGKKHVNVYEITLNEGKQINNWKTKSKPIII